MRDRCKILDVSRAASTTETETVAAAEAEAAAEAGAAAEQTSLPCHKCRNCLHISLVIASAWWRRRSSRGERPPLLCTSAAHTHTHVYFRLFCFAWLIWQTLQAFPHLHTLTQRQRRRSSACESKCCSEREWESRRDNVAVGSGPSVERVSAKRRSTFKVRFQAKQLPLLSLLLAHIQMEKRARAGDASVSLPLRQQRAP